MSAVEVGLFPEPEHAELPSDGAWLVGPAPCRWRYMFLGEDAEQLMAYGHVPVEELSDLLVVAGVEDDDWADVTRWTYASISEMCPRHLTWFEGCLGCAILRSGDGPLVTLTARADSDDAERSTPGWFSVTVVDLEG